MNHLLFYNETMENVFKEFIELECFKFEQIPCIEIADDHSQWQKLPNQNLMDMAKTLAFLQKVLWNNHNLRIRLNQLHEINFSHSDFFKLDFSKNMNLRWQALRPVLANMNQDNYLHPAFTNDLDYSKSKNLPELTDETMKLRYLKERLFYRHRSIVLWNQVNPFCWKYSLETLIPEAINGRNFIQFLFYSISFFDKNAENLRRFSVLESMIDIREEKKFTLKICIDSLTFRLNLTEKQIEKLNDN